MLDQAAIDRLRGITVPPQRHFIAGEWVDSADGATLDVTSPIDGGLLTTLADGGAEDVDRAVSAARAAYEGGRGREPRRPRARRCCCGSPS